MFFVLPRALSKQKNLSESLWGIEPQTFGFRTPMLYRRATETKCGRGPLRNSCMTSSSIFLPSSKLIIFLILSTNMTLSTSLILTKWMDVCHMRRVSCHITLVTRRKTSFSEIKVFTEVSWQDHKKFFRTSLLLLSMENCRKLPECNLSVT